ncbi:MAG: 3-oxoacyl-ACP reductase FabG [Halobacteria archaeon]|nr:3-oxoacyl-ACP reductase FabG [Halobacteria archaeon]
MSLEEQTCVVTGGSRGIGRGIAEELGSKGAEVVVNYHSSEEEAYEVVDNIESAGGSAIPVQCNVADFDEVAAMAEQVHDEFGSVDVLVNNAGITIDRKMVDMTREDWQKVINVNLGGVFNCTKHFYNDIYESDQGRLINISSVIGQQGNYGQANYATSKSGLFGFTRTLALELAPSQSTANAVAPGYTNTDMLAKVRDDIKDKIREKIPLDRFAEVDDIAGIVRFLASEDSAYMTGQVIGVNGGMHW